MNCLTDCDNCPFKSKNRIKYRGDVKSPLVIVGEGPGGTELVKGYPFAGKNGEVVLNLLPPDLDPFITTALSCLPRDKDLDKLAVAVRACRNRVLTEVGSHPRKAIIAFGNGALWALTGNYDLKITQVRGQIFETPYGPVVASVHPAFLMRGGGSYEKFKEDIQLAIKLLNDEKTNLYVSSKHTVIDSEQDVIDFGKLLMEQKLVAADIETTGFDHLSDSILSNGFCWEDDKTYIVPGEYTYLLRDAYEHRETKFIWHNGKFDVRFLRANDINAFVDEDTMLLSYSLDETKGMHDLDQVASDVLKAPDHKHMVAKYLEGKDSTYADIPSHILYEYQGLDLAKTFQIFKVLRERVRTDVHLEKLYTRTLIPASELLCNIELYGFAFNEEACKENATRLEGEIEEYRTRICDIAGYIINPNSPAQVKKLAYEELKIPSKMKTTGKDVVVKWPDSPFKRALQKYRIVTKAYSTYVKGLRKSISIDGKAHSTYKLHGTRTGRLSSSEPNLQNIPRSALMKRQFMARKGYILIDGDASQAELRSLALQSKDPDLCAIYRDPKRSLHKEVAVEQYGSDYDEDQYVRAKAVNFGIAYGRKSYSIAEEFDISVKEAQRLIDAWFARFPVAKAFIEKCRKASAKKQTLISVFGRKCRPGWVTSENYDEVANQFANFPHQSTASDITLHVAMWLYPKLISIGAGIVNLVHDSIVIECPDEIEKVRQVQAWVHEGFALIPRQWGLTSIPFLADTKLEYYWGNPFKTDEEWLAAREKRYGTNNEANS